MGIGDEVTLVAFEQLVDGGTVVLLAAAVKHMLLRRDEHPDHFGTSPLRAPARRLRQRRDMARRRHRPAWRGRGRGNSAAFRATCRALTWQDRALRGRRSLP